MIHVLYNAPWRIKGVIIVEYRGVEIPLKNPGVDLQALMNTCNTHFGDTSRDLGGPVLG